MVRMTPQKHSQGEPAILLLKDLLCNLRSIFLPYQRHFIWITFFSLIWQTPRGWSHGAKNEVNGQSAATDQHILLISDPDCQMWTRLYNLSPIRLHMLTHQHTSICWTATSQSMVMQDTAALPIKPLNLETAGFVWNKWTCKNIVSTINLWTLIK